SDPPLSGGPAVHHIESPQLVRYPVSKGSPVPNGEIAARTQSAVPASAVVEVHRRVRQLCLQHAARLPFHGWHHVNFVRSKAVQFATMNGSDAGVVEVAALVHDLNYLIRRNSPASAGRRLRLAILAAAGIAGKIAQWVDDVVN